MIATTEGSRIAWEIRALIESARQRNLRPMLITLGGADAEALVAEFAFLMDRIKAGLTRFDGVYVRIVPEPHYVGLQSEVRGE